MYPLSKGKKAMWDIGKMYKSCIPSLIIGEMIFKDNNISIDELDRAINKLIESDDIIRTSIIDDDKETIHPFYYHKVNIIDLVGKTNEESDKIIQDYTQEKLEKNKLYSFRIVLYNNGRTGIIIKLHHIISDAWTMVLIGSRINYHYRNDKTTTLDKGISYTEYLTRDNRYLISNRYLQDENYWKDKISDFDDSAIKLNNNCIGTVEDIKARRKSIKINEKHIKQYCKNNSISLFSFHVAVLAIYMARMNHKDKVIIGTPVLGREGREKFSLGYYVNMVPLKININMKWTFYELLNEVKKEIFNTFKHTKYPYIKIREAYTAEFGTNKKIFDTVLSYQNAKNVDYKDYNTNWIFNQCAMDGLEINISNRDSEPSITYEIDYQINKYSDNDIDQILSHMDVLIKDVIGNHSKKLRELDILPDKGKNILLNEFNDTETVYDDTKVLHELFYGQVTKTPNKNAVIYKDESMTYRELNEKSNSLARVLQNEGVRSNTIVGIIAEPSIEMIIGILAILKSGGTYLPLDINQPTDRIIDIIKNCNVNKIIVHTKKDIADILNVVQQAIPIAGQLNNSIDNIDNVNEVDDLAYILHTSGSTGKPKGIMTTHKNVVGYVNTLLKEINIEGKVVLQQSSYTFDLFTEEVFPTLFSGGTLVIVERETVTNIERLISAIKDYKVQIISSVPSVVDMLNKHMIIPESLEIIISGGDVLKNNHVDNLIKKDIDIYNSYGPTETTVCATYNKCNEGNVSLIGSPIGNYKVYIMDRYENLMPIGYEGEIVIGGIGVSKGYYNDSSLTEKKFIKSPFNESDILYKSGDKGRYLVDGNIEYKGRLDRQVKILGNRIELDEIENKINQVTGVKNSVMTCIKTKDTKQLVCYYISSTIEENTLRDILKKSLPAYMIPNQIIRLETFPLTVNGKIDMEKLNKNKSTNKVYVKPKTSLEKQLVSLYEKVLNIKRAGVTDDFFELGGDSLKAMELIVAADKLGIGLEIKDVYNYPTIRKLTQKDFELDFCKYEDAIDIIPKKINRKNSGDILITGATGWLGIHLVNDLLKQTKDNIYCIVRGNNPEEKMEKVFAYYFQNMTHEEKQRIKILRGDITLDRLGLSDKDYNIIKDKIRIIIHAAAYVKYHGKLELLHDINVTGTQNIIHMTKILNAELYHMSTISISGQYMLQHPKLKGSFTEKDLYIGQHFAENEYILSKFLAESEITKEIENGLDASIIRVGNLTQRISDGKFQINKEDNGFYGRLRELLMLKKVPKEFLNQKVEMTPVDQCSNAIIKIIKSKPEYTGIYHVFNPNKVKVIAVLHIIEKMGYKILPASMDNITTLISHSKIKLKHLLSINNKNTPVSKNIAVDNNLTTNYLEKVGFTWDKIDEDYLRAIIKNIELR
ncbi:non-ribosomal peptide synthetase [Vallitalea guaymasensis]|uniref:non-ribosomal peptide synthetase n=1 Tax=Vallitalea guaymasensis TaxID=1185412 RepID=UPI000DE4201F|nr:non-ribosomal peptide synthetase [Vallitalea guaymasensis]